MIEIKVIMCRDADVDSLAQVVFYTAPEPIFTPELDAVKHHWEDTYNFFKNCVDQQLVLNTTCLEVSEDHTKFLTRYFSTTSENAQAFLDAFLDMSADFSIKKMWSQYGMTLLTSQSEIDFDTVEDNFELVSDDGGIFKVKY